MYYVSYFFCVFFRQNVRKCSRLQRHVNWDFEPKLIVLYCMYEYLTGARKKVAFLKDATSSPYRYFFLRIKKASNVLKQKNMKNGYPLKTFFTICS